ncbi:MAG: uroporphyrinogen decarboxylase family protein [Planctomycetota bacterium]
MLSHRENFIRNVRRTGPEWIPADVHISSASWEQLREDLDDVCSRHTILFPNHKSPSRDWSTWHAGPEPGSRETDPWGAVWQFDFPGLEGGVVEHPLDDWAKFDGFAAPDPLRFSDRRERDLLERLEGIPDRKAKGDLISGGLDHGYFLMRLWYLRGFVNLMMDIATDEPRLHDLIDLIVERNNVIIGEHIKAGVDTFTFPEDIGTQTASILSPADFRKWVVPAYKRMMGPAKDAGVIINTHSDGYIMELVDDLLDCGCDILNPQDLCNGIDEIARAMKGRCCIKIDVDRQRVVPFGTPQEVHDLIEEEVRKLGGPEGGLEFVVGIYPPTPAENVDAVCSALEKFRTYWWDGRG